jgi:hypothetical protein
MPTEQFIRKKVIKILEKEKWIVWWPPKVKFRQNDIFGIIDLLAIKGGEQKNIQLTTLSNISTKRKKITNFLKKFKVKLRVEIWGWDRKRKEFRKEKIKLEIKKRPKVRKS